MKVVSLASGSGGNAYCVVSADGDVLLIDCGICCRELVKRMAVAELDPERIVAAVFTHDHTDHVKGVPVFHKHYSQAELFANLMTAEAIAAVMKMDPLDFLTFENGQEFTAGPFSVRAFSIPHDVPDPVGYVISVDGETYFHATDVGTPLDSVGVNLALADIATLESNHDPVMLHQCSRPECLKQRIRGPRGHLSNFEAAELVRRFATPRLKRLNLAHLSRECNVPHLAERTMQTALAEMKRPDVELHILSQDDVIVA